MRRIAFLATVGALTCACAVTAGCGATATGARREGPAPVATVRPRPAAAPAIASDPPALAAMLRQDRSVSPDVRQDLTPCAGDDYPMDTDSGDLTSGDGPDLVVNITTCGDGLGIAAYVYRLSGGKYRNVFADERPPVYGSVADGRLEIVHEVYRTDDPVSYPTGEESVTYAWSSDRFVPVTSAYQDLPRAKHSPPPGPAAGTTAAPPDADSLDPAPPLAGTAARATATATGQAGSAGSTESARSTGSGGSTGSTGSTGATGAGTLAGVTRAVRATAPARPSATGAAGGGAR